MSFKLGSLVALTLAVLPSETLAADTLPLPEWAYPVSAQAAAPPPDAPAPAW